MAEAMSIIVTGLNLDGLRSDMKMHNLGSSNLRCCEYRKQTKKLITETVYH